MLEDDDVAWLLSQLSQGYHVRLDGLSHNLGLGSWQVRPLLKAMMAFLMSY